MKSSMPRGLGWKDVILVILPALIWLGESRLRASVTIPHCAIHPEMCGMERVNRFDRMAMGPSSKKADDASTDTQNLTAVLAAGSLLAWQGLRVAQGAMSPGAALISFGTDFVTLLQITAWNGATIEFLRLTLQRPRPFVMRDPVGYGGNTSHYSSFYSGHTSFAFAMAMGGFLLLRRRKVPANVRGALTVLMFSLALTTGILRVVARAHYLSDVIVGAGAGIFFAYFFVRRQISKS